VGVELPAPADRLDVAVLVLSNGVAIEQLGDPETVDLRCDPWPAAQRTRHTRHATRPPGICADRPHGLETRATHAMGRSWLIIRSPATDRWHTGPLEVSCLWFAETQIVGDIPVTTGERVDSVCEHRRPSPLGPHRHVQHFGFVDREFRTIDVAPDAHDDLAERRPTMRCAIAYPLMAYHQSVGGA
jgi:hypothetical protein